MDPIWFDVEMKREGWFIKVVSEQWNCWMNVPPCGCGIYVNGSLKQQWSKQQQQQVIVCKYRILWSSFRDGSSVAGLQLVGLVGVIKQVFLSKKTYTTLQV